MLSNDALFFRWFGIMGILAVAMYSGQILVGIFAVVVIIISLFPVFIGNALRFLINAPIFLLQSIVIIFSLTITVLAGFPALIGNLLSALSELVIDKFESILESIKRD